ncbi:MAG: MgtC/SapB family protein [Eubacteriales bacterium]
MQTIFDILYGHFPLMYMLHDLNPLSVFFRLIISFIAGGIIGLERGINSHPAGFRTHILICVAATLSTLTGQYICMEIAPHADPARLGAQIITGMGFIGAGTIFATGKHRIKGLTTAAGLWASACLGLTIGIGFYSAAFFATILIFLSLALLPKVEDIIYSNAKLLNIYIELADLQSLKILSSDIQEQGIKILEKHISSTPAITSSGLAFHLTLKLPHSISSKEFMKQIELHNAVLFVEEI